MKHTSNLSTRLYILFLGLTLIIFLGPACQDTHVTRTRLKLEDTPEDKAVASTRPVPLAPPTCPPAGLAPLQPSQPGAGHRVTLSWNRSLRSNRPEDNAVGYCLYRSKKKNAARKNATCTDCERVNSIPVAGTTCVDDLVQGGATYYYVATAISGRGRLSAASNEITVVIPSGRPAAASSSAASPPFCRGQPSSR